MKFYFFCLLSLIFMGGSALSQIHVNDVGLQTDNDSYLGQGSDRYYTNGIFVYFRHALRLQDTSGLKNKVMGIEAGQKKYNPKSGQIPAPQYVDRPFSAYLYAGASLNMLYKNESNLTLGAQLGEM